MDAIYFKTLTFQILSEGLFSRKIFKINSNFFTNEQLIRSIYIIYFLIPNQYHLLTKKLFQMIIHFNYHDDPNLIANTKAVNILTVALFLYAILHISWIEKNKPDLLNSQRSWLSWYTLITYKNIKANFMCEIVTIFGKCLQ